MVMQIVMLRPSPERKEMSQAPRKVVTGMRVDGLELAQRHPYEHGGQMDCSGDQAGDQRRYCGAETEKQGLPRRCVFSRESERGGVLVVDAVDVAIQGTPMHGPMKEVVVRVFDEEPQDDLRQHDGPAGEGSFITDAKLLHQRVEEDDHRHFDGEVDEQDVLDAVPLVGCGGHFLVLDLVSTEDAGEGVTNHPRNATSKVHQFMTEKCNEAGGQEGIIPECIVCPPQTFEGGILRKLLASQRKEIRICCPFRGR